MRRLSRRLLGPGGFAERPLLILLLMYAVIGLLFVVVVILLPNGLIGSSLPRLQRWLNQRGQA